MQGPKPLFSCSAQSCTSSHDGGNNGVKPFSSAVKSDKMSCSVYQMVICTEASCSSDEYILILWFLYDFYIFSHWNRPEMAHIVLGSATAVYFYPSLLCSAQVCIVEIPAPPCTWASALDSSRLHTEFFKCIVLPSDHREGINPKVSFYCHQSHCQILSNIMIKVQLHLNELSRWGHFFDSMQSTSKNCTAERKLIANKYILVRACSWETTAQWK